MRLFCRYRRSAGSKKKHYKRERESHDGKWEKFFFGLPIDDKKKLSTWNVQVLHQNNILGVKCKVVSVYCMLSIFTSTSLNIVFISSKSFAFLSSWIPSRRKLFSCVESFRKTRLLEGTRYFYPFLSHTHNQSSFYYGNHDAFPRREWKSTVR